MNLNRRLWIGVLVVGALLAPTFAPAAEVDKLLPDNTSAVLVINVRQMIDSDLARKFNFVPEVEKFIKDSPFINPLERVGLDPLKDITSISIAMADVGELRIPGNKRGLLIVHGNFDLAKLHDLADEIMKQDENLKFTKLDNIRIYQAVDQEIFWAFLGKQFLVVSASKGYVIEAIAKNADRQTTSLARGMEELVAGQKGKPSIWFATLISDDLKKQVPDDGPPKQIIDKVDSISAGLSLTNDIKVNLRVRMSDVNLATQLRLMLDQIKEKAGADLVANQELQHIAAQLREVLDSVKFSLDAGLVNIEIVVPGEVLDKAIKAIKNQQ